MTTEQLQLVQSELNSICYQFFMDHAKEVLQDAVERVEEDEDIDLSEALSLIKITDIDISVGIK